MINLSTFKLLYTTRRRKKKEMLNDGKTHETSLQKVANMESTDELVVGPKTIRIIFRKEGKIRNIIPRSLNY
jgi:hypothetical protein